LEGVNCLGASASSFRATALRVTRRLKPKKVAPAKKSDSCLTARARGFVRIFSRRSSSTDRRPFCFGLELGSWLIVCGTACCCGCVTGGLTDSVLALSSGPEYCVSRFERMPMFVFWCWIKKERTFHLDRCCLLRRLGGLCAAPSTSFLCPPAFTPHDISTIFLDHHVGEAASVLAQVTGSHSLELLLSQS